MPMIYVRIRICTVLCIRMPVCIIVCCRPIKSIFEELVYEGVIIKCPKVRLSEYDGEYRYGNWFVCLFWFM